MNNSSQKELPPMLNEFRTALEAEIKAVSTNSYNNAIPMSNGRKLNSLADEYQYQFKVENNINTPDGAPCTLIISDKQQLDAIIVSYEGSSIIVSVKSDLGEFVPVPRNKSIFE